MRDTPRTRLAPDDVSATEHSASPVLLRGTACHPTFELHQHYQLLKTVARLICFCSHTLYSLIQVAYFLYGALVVTLRTCYGALKIVVLLLLFYYTCQNAGRPRKCWTKGRADDGRVSLSCDFLFLFFSEARAEIKPFDRF